MAEAWRKFEKQYPGKSLDFQVRVHIIEARELQPRDRNGMSDPVCFVSALNQKQNTITHPKTTSCSWDHLMFFEYKATPGDFFFGKIDVTVFDANTVLRNVEIGSYQFDVASIYERPGHELYRQWIALTDKTGTHSGIQGYLRVSITVLGPKDVAPAHKEEDEWDEMGDEEDLQSLVLMPPSVKTQENALQLFFYRAEDLPKMDTFGKCDGYVSVKFGGSPEAKTDVVEKSYTPSWLQKIVVPVVTPTMADLIKIQVRDWDKGTSDENVGTIYLRLSDITKTPPEIDWAKPRWVNIYSIADGDSSSGDVAKSILEGTITGNAYRGRVLMAADCKVAPGTKLGVYKVSAANEPPVDSFVLRLDLLEASEIQTEDSIEIELSIGPHVKKMKKVDVKGGSAVWYKGMEELIVKLPTDLSQAPDVFINVYKKGMTSKSRLGFIRLKPSDLSQNAKPVWDLFERDLLGGADESKVVGFLQYSLSFGLQSKMGARAKVDTPQTKKYQLRAHLYQAKELPAGDATGLSDPYAVVRCGKFNAKTRTVHETCFPLWYESLSLDIELPQPLDIAPDVNVQVYDWDRLGKNDFLGRFSVPVKSLKKDMPTKPQWYPIYQSISSLTEGEVLASFQLIPIEEASSVPIPKSIAPKFEEQVLSISTIGVRDLLPRSILGISNVYVEFDCGTEKKVKTKKSDKPSSSNPDHMEMLELPVNVPDDPLFAPPINIRVYDSGILTRLLGTRSISLAQYMPEGKGPQADAELPKTVKEIPGSIFIKEEVPVKQEKEGKEEVDQVRIDMPEEEETQHLLSPPKDDRDRQLESKKDALSRALANRTGPEVEESFLEGVEEVSEEPAKPERPSLDHELELDFKDPPFCSYKIYRAKNLQKLAVGEWKGKFRLYGKSEKREHNNIEDLVKPTPYVVRVYCLEAYQLVPKDSDGSNNPYLRLSDGKVEINDVNETKQATSRPTFFKLYEIQSTFPAQSVLSVSIYDWDQIGSHDLIGTTKIDLSTRVLCKEWQKLKMKPTEYRTLWNPSSSNPQGQLKLWIDILTPEEAKRIAPEEIAPPSPIDYELRCTIWETRNVPFMDKNMSDVFCSGYPVNQAPQYTDTHWRCEDGMGLFNWRLKFPITLPLKTAPYLKLQIWDKDFLNPNDAIGEASLNLRSFLLNTYKKKLTSASLPRQWITLSHPSNPGPRGEMDVTIEILTKEEASRRPAGFGREPPEALPEPNRPDTSFNPLFNPGKVISKLVWGKHKKKIIAAGAAAVCCLILILILFLKFIF